MRALAAACIAHAATALVAPMPRVQLQTRIYGDKGVFGPRSPDIEYMPKAKDAPQRQVGLWPRGTATTFFRLITFTWVVVFALTLASSTLTLPGVADAGADISRGRVIADGVMGRCFVVRKRTFSPRALWDANYRRRLMRGAALSTQSPLLGDLALDLPRWTSRWRWHQRWRCLTYFLAHGSAAHVVGDAVLLRSSLALDGKGLPYDARRRLGDANDNRGGACGGAGVLLLTAVLGVCMGGICHLQNTMRAPRAVGGGALCAALAGARCVAQCKLLKGAHPRSRAIKNLLPRLAVLLVANYAMDVPPAVVLGGLAAGLSVSILAAPRVVGTETEFALYGDKRDALRRKGKGRALAVSLSKNIKREPARLNPFLCFALALLLVPTLRIGLLQLVPALATCAARPGALSGRGLDCPPGFVW